MPCTRIRRRANRDGHVCPFGREDRKWSVRHLLRQSGQKVTATVCGIDEGGFVQVKLIRGRKRQLGHQLTCGCREGNGGVTGDVQPEPVGHQSLEGGLSVESGVDQ